MVFNSFSGNDFFELTLLVCTEKDAYVQRLGLLRKTSCASSERFALLVFRLRRTLAPSALDTRASRSWLISHGPCYTESLTKTNNYIKKCTPFCCLCIFQNCSESSKKTFKVCCSLGSPNSVALSILYHTCLVVCFLQCSVMRYEIPPPGEEKHQC